jgi:hypothetical protein
MEESKYMCACGCCVTFVVSIAIMIFMSVTSIDAYQVGIDYSYITKSLSPQIYSPGYHYLGFGHTFFVYPTTVQNMEFSDERSADRPPINSRTDDGLSISFKASFQYTLISAGLYDLYMKFGKDYRTPCEKFAVDILNDQATKYDANTFFFD